jgi:hypothetical protein
MLQVMKDLYGATAMRRMFSLVLFLLVLPAAARGADFRQCRWGDDEAVVRKTETAQFNSASTPREGMKALIFNETLAGLEAFVIYILDGDKLVQAKYVFPQEHIESSRFLDDFARVDRILREENGRPVESGEIWENGALRGRVEPGRMIAIGELVLLSRWDAGETEIVHTLRGENADIDHEVDYVSKRLGRVGGKVMDGIRPRRSF